MKYWHWLFKGNNGRPGIKRFINRWLILHIGIGFILSIVVPLPIYDAADTIIIPLAMLFVGFIFVWLHLQNILNSEKISAMLSTHPYSYEKYACVYQTAILMFIFTLCVWGVGDLHVYDDILGRSIFCFLVKVFLYSMVSLTLRECWHLVLGVSKISVLNMTRTEE